MKESKKKEPQVKIDFEKQINKKLTTVRWGVGGERRGVGVGGLRVDLAFSFFLYYSFEFF